MTVTKTRVIDFDSASRQRREIDQKRASTKKRAKTAINRAIADINSYRDIPEIASLLEKLHESASRL